MDNKLTFGDFPNDSLTDTLTDTPTDKLVVKDNVVKPTKAPSIKVKKVKALSRAVQSKDLSKLFETHGIPKEGNALVLKKPKDHTAIYETTYEAIDTPAVEKPVEITQPRTDPTPIKRQSKHKERGFSLAEDLYLEVKDYFHWFVKGLSNPDRVPIVNVFREAKIEPLKYPMIFNDNEVLEYFLDCVSGFFTDSKKNHGHRPNFIELGFTYLSANGKRHRPKLIIHKKGYFIQR